MKISAQPVSREVFIDYNKEEMLEDINNLSYDEFIDKWSMNPQVKSSVHSRVFNKWIQGPNTDWQKSIRNAIILSTQGINNSRMARVTDVSINTIYNIKLGRLYTTKETLIKLEEALGIELYK